MYGTESASSHRFTVKGAFDAFFSKTCQRGSAIPMSGAGNAKRRKIETTAYGIQLANLWPKQSSFRVPSEVTIFFIYFIARESDKWIIFIFQYFAMLIHLSCAALVKAGIPKSKLKFLGASFYSRGCAGDRVHTGTVLNHMPFIQEERLDTLNPMSGAELVENIKARLQEYPECMFILNMMHPDDSWSTHPKFINSFLRLFHKFEKRVLIRFMRMSHRGEELWMTAYAEDVAIAIRKYWDIANVVYDSTTATDAEVIGFAINLNFLQRLLGIFPCKRHWFTEQERRIFG
jgi:hypothetical protein